MWLALAVVGVLTAIAFVVWTARRRRPAGPDAFNHRADLVDPLDLPLPQLIPPRGVLMPVPSEDSLTLRVLLRGDLERSKQSPPPFTLEYRTISAGLMPWLSDFTPLPQRSALATVMRDLGDHIRQDSLAFRSGETVTLLRSDLDISSLYPAQGGGLRGWARNATNIVDQARLSPIQVPVEALDGGKRAFIQVGKAGLAVAGVSISWPALALTAGFVALDTANQAQRRELDRRVDTFIQKSERKDLERRIAGQRGNEEELNRLVSRLLDGTAPDPAEVAVLRLRIRQEFDEACVAIRRVQGTVARFGHGESATKALVRGLGLDQPGIVISELLHARGAIDQQRRFLVLEVANESLNPVAVAGGYYADNLAKQVGDTEEANRALRGLIDDLRDLQLMEKNVLARRGNEKLTSSLKAALSLAFSGEGVSDGDDVSIHSTLAIDSAGRVFQLASTIDIDAIERQDLQLRLAGALRALMARQEQEPQVRGRASASTPWTG